MAKSKSDISLNDLKAMLPHEESPAEQEAALRALAALSQEDRNLLAAVQESPYRLTTLEQFREFPANTEYFIGTMEGLIEAVRSFDGSPAAIGYTVYYYAEDMNMADGLKLLKVDGVEPNDDTIRSGAYPFRTFYYAVMNAGEPEDGPTAILYRWLLSPEGQKLVDHEGYVAVLAPEE